MKEKIKQIIDTKQFHIIMLVLIIFSIIFVAGVISLKYNVEGEGNLPFLISKISIISNVEGNDSEDATNKWNLMVNQNNDIYIYIKKNEGYKDTEIIESVVLDNFNITQNSKIGEIKLLKPDSNINSVIFKNTAENETEKIEYTVSTDSSIKEMKISNQGGLIVFRYAINNIGNYISNDDEQINHSELLKKLNVNNEDLKFKVSFDVYIKLKGNKNYKSNIELELPANDVVNGGTQSMEYTDLSNIVFKRITKY